MTYTAAEINTAIANGRTVTAVASDLERKHQPRRGASVELTQAWDAGQSIRANASGFNGRFRVSSITIEGDYIPAQHTGV